MAASGTVSHLRLEAKISGVQVETIMSSGDCMQSTSDKKAEITAIYFPSWHPDPHYSAWFGPGWSEWELIKTARPLYPGHYQPKEPAWGYFDESEPSWAEKQIDLAAEHGITTFMFDWYWYNGVQILQNALEKGFLQSANRAKLKFFLMWANHEWWNWPAMTGKPGMGQAPWLFMHHTIDDLRQVIRYCAQNYFSQPNYLKIADEPVFAVYQPNYLQQQLSSQVANVEEPLSVMRREAQRWGFKGLHFIANIGCLGGSPYSVYWDLIPELVRAGYDSVFPYNLVTNGKESELPKELPAFDYRDIVEAHSYVWRQCVGKGLPFHPSVSMGLDITPRWHRGVKLPFNKETEPNYQPFVENCTPELFGELCSDALRFLNKDDTQTKILFINAWNEWTEGMYLLPDKKHGTGFLQALKRAVNCQDLPAAEGSFV